MYPGRKQPRPFPKYVLRDVAFVPSGWLTGAVQGTKASSKRHLTKGTRNQKKSSSIRSRPPRRRLKLPNDDRLKPLRSPLPQLLQHDAPPRPPKTTNAHLPSPPPCQRPWNRRIRRYLLQQTFEKGGSWCWKWRK